MENCKYVLGMLMSLAFLVSCTSGKISSKIEGKWTPIGLDTTKGAIRDSSDGLGYVIVDMSVAMGPEVIDFHSDSLFADGIFRAAYTLKGKTIRFKRHPNGESVQSEFNTVNDTLFLDDFPEKGLKMSFKALK